MVSIFYERNFTNLLELEAVRKAARRNGNRDSLESNTFLSSSMEVRKWAL